tara:strand:- start:2590 stop:3507 length:918 start_codon:yes stop_codon:yes gene_type:complete
MEKKKPGRKKKNEIIPPSTTPSDPVQPTVSKKRGRKPKGGKIITDVNIDTSPKPLQQNIILHLKCSLDDINNVYNINFIQSENNILPFNNNSIDNNLVVKQNDNITNNTIQNTIQNTNQNDNNISNKLKSLSASLNSNIIPNKVSNCFWCTCNFDGPPIFIPKHKHNDKYQVYGIYCSPECAAAFLFNENIDNSQKFERYYLLNSLYSNIYNYKSNIIPAPPPFYILNKYLGTLSIEEYRELNKNKQIISVIDKPISRLLPEIFEDNDEYNIKNLPTENKSNTYTLYRKNKKNLSHSFSSSLQTN